MICFNAPASTKILRFIKKAVCEITFNILFGKIKLTKDRMGQATETIGIYSDRFIQTCDFN